jgi:tetratricopeptide (TPR) repeat protein
VAEEAIALALENGAVEGLCMAEMLCGIVLTRTGAPLAARPHAERALALCRQHYQDYPGELIVNVWWSCELLLTKICFTQGELAEAERHLQRALQVCQVRGKRRGETGCLYLFGEMAFQARDYRKACENYRQVLALELNIGDRQTIGMAQLSLGETQRMLGDYGQARGLLQRAQQKLGEVGAIYEWRALACLGRLDLYLGDARSARQWLAQLGAAIDPAPLPEVKRFALLTQALLALQRGDPQQAMAYVEAARQLQPAAGNPYEGASILIVMGHAAAAAARWAEARTAYQQAVRLAETLNILDVAAEAHAGLANVAIGAGDHAAACAHAEAILALLAEQPRVGLDEPFVTYLACHRVLAATSDARACDILAQGYALLLEYAGRIEDDALRQSFLENVAEHRELRQLHQAATWPCLQSSS